MCLLWQINHSLFWKNSFCFIALLLSTLLKENSCRCQVPLSPFSQMVHPQCRAVQRPAGKWVHYRSYPKERETHMCYRNGMNLPTWRRPDNVQGSNLFLQFLKWSIKEPDRCSTHPEYNSKSGRWHRAKSPAMRGALVPLVVTCLKKWTCPTSKEALSQLWGLPRVQRKISWPRK